VASQKPVDVGDLAPDFTLPGTSNKSYSLSQFRGQTVVLVFYPGDDTLVCTKQLCAYNNELSQFSNVNAQILVQRQTRL
jgi:peroxiredoxin Q/BCP